MMSTLIEQIKTKAQTFQKANLLRHSYIATPLYNFLENKNNEYINFLTFQINIDTNFDDHKLKYSPRYIYFSEFTSHHILKTIPKNSSSNPTLIKDLFFTRTNTEEEKGNKSNEQENNKNQSNINQYSRTILDDAFEDFYNANHKYRKNLNNVGADKNKEFIKNSIFKIKKGPNSRSIDTNIIEIQHSKNPSFEKFQDEFSIAIANTKIKKENIFNSIIGSPNLASERSDRLVKLLNGAEEVKADALLLPEVSIPFNYLFQIADEARRKQRLIIAGLEHINVNNICYNFIATCLPMEHNGIKDVVIVLRLKNHYSPHEEFTIIDQGKIIPKPDPATYNLFKWRDVNFSVYNVSVR